MKFFIILLTLIVSVSFAFGQINITDPDNDQGNPIDCTSFTDQSVVNFTDDGGTLSDYSSNINETITICPDLPNGPKLRVNFSVNDNFTWDIDGSDTLYVFDGPDDGSPLLGAFNSETNPNGVTLTSSFENNSSGCLTFVFVSDNADEGTGWEANITCSNPPQPMDLHIEAFVNGVGTDALDPADTGYVDICPGDSVLLVAKPDLLYSLENTGSGYSQNVDDLTYVWEFSNGIIGPDNDSLWFVPPAESGYFVNLLITDDFPNVEMISCKIRVGQTPIFSASGPLEDTVCFDTETIILGGLSSSGETAGIDLPEGSFEVGGSLAGTLPLPDGSGDTYSTDISLVGFPDNATFSDASNL